MPAWTSTKTQLPTRRAKSSATRSAKVRRRSTSRFRSRTGGWSCWCLIRSRAMSSISRAVDIWGVFPLAAATKFGCSPNSLAQKPVRWLQKVRKSRGAFSRIVRTNSACGAGCSPDNPDYPVWPASAVVVGTLRRSRDSVERLDVARKHRMDAVLALHHAVDDQDRLPVGDLAVAVVNVRFDRHVDLPELVFEREESNLFRGRWRLPGDHQAGDPDVLVVGDRWQLVALERAQGAQAVSTEVDEVVAGRQVGDPVLELVGVEGVDRRQCRRGSVEAQLGLLVDASPQAFAVPPFLPAPQQLAPRLAESVEGPDHDQVADGARADRSTTQPAQVIIESRVWPAPVTLVDDRLPTLLAEVAHVIESDAHREA